MMRPHKLVGLLVAAVLVVAGSVMGTAQARANPISPNKSTVGAAQPKPASQGQDPWFTRPEPSATTRQYVDLVKSTVQALGAGARVLNYKVAIKRFGSHTYWRRDFAAGWLAYRSITNITAGERAKVNAIARDNGISFNVVSPMNGCTGQSTSVDHEVSGHSTGYEVWTYYNSCETSDMIRNYTNTVSVMCGVLAAVTVAAIAPAGPVAGLAGALVGSLCLEAVHAKVNDIVTAQEHSSKDAVIIESTSPLKWVGTYRIEPQ